MLSLAPFVLTASVAALVTLEGLLAASRVAAVAYAVLCALQLRGDLTPGERETSSPS